MAKLTVADLQQMKKDGKKIAAGVVYEAQMTKLFERAGVDLLSVGDSLSRNVLGHASPDDYTVEEMLVLAGAVARTAQRAVVNVDMPGRVTDAGPKEVERVSRLIKELGADTTKIDIRMREEELFDEVQAVLDAGLAAYPQIGFGYVAGGEMHSSPEDRDQVLKWAKKLDDAGASMIDLTMVSHEIYEAATKSVSIPVIGGQTGPEADGKIHVGYGLVGYSAALLDRKDAPESAAKFMYERIEKAVADIHAGDYS